MNWQDIYDIAIALEEAHPDKDAVNLRFTDLRAWVVDLEGFVGEANGCNEKILEAIQMAWLDERA